MKKPRGYCKGCRDRRAEDPEHNIRDCHIDCKKYKQFKKELAEWYAFYNKARATAIISDRRPWLARTKGVKDDDNES